MTPCGLTGQLKGLKIRCNLIKAGPKSLIRPSSGGGNRLQVHLSPSNWKKTNSQQLQGAFCLVCQKLGVSVSGISHICSLFRSNTCLWNTQNRQTRGGDEFISPLSTLLKCSCVACKRKKKKKGGGGGGWRGWRRREALTRALRHNHDTIKIISRRLLVARKAIFTPCNRVWLSD